MFDRSAGGLIPAHAGKTSTPSRAAPRKRAHPRSRGENNWTRPPCPTRSGSSPLTRGKHGERSDVGPRRGLIPAHAGKTSRSCSRAGCRGAHPRSRGENELSAKVAHNAQGSSPLTRGKHQVGGRLRDRLGLIPAHAGKTSRGVSEDSGHGAHPRSRGENQIQVLKAHMGDGSSPLTRGKLIADRITGKTIGLIPAHAGKTSRTPRCVRMSRAHPRSRGENA